jgi:ribonuclease HI
MWWCKLQLKHLANTTSPQNWFRTATNPSYRVQLIWVPGHEGIVGNETADQLARTGSEHASTGPEPACGISVGVCKKAVRDWMNRNHKKHWEAIIWLKQAKGIYTRALCQENEGSAEAKQRPIKMGDRTGHCHLKGHLFKLELTDDPTCEICLEVEQPRISYVIVRPLLI